MTAHTQIPQSTPAPHLNESQTETQRLDEERRAEFRLQFARAWMQRKREEQARAIEEFQNDPERRAVFDDLDRRAAERGTRIVQSGTNEL